ncbi:peptidoglycan recognition family protein [Caballeronia sp. LZ035]|uniref:peptidoglycan recognition protein family protein n=1 Tax=Caballeronia sp. LZ035 TaxID=3038568 RepID=UPI00285B58EE|nr:peptidoglycan recognition family protein [Caballeronia sp. LZ035]MDR5760986.1 peptidoglycan recognition family protein [Caballeronia sp. LZ035]
MSLSPEYTIEQAYLTRPSKRRSGEFINPGVKFVVAHDTGNPGSTARANVSYYQNSRNEKSASAHIFVDDKSIVECIPAMTGDQPEKAWHVLYGVPTDNRLFGFDANDAAIGVEYCYGPKIDADEAYRRYVWVIASILLRFRLPSDKVVGHHFLDPHRKTDPVSGLARSRRTYDQLLRDIATKHAALAEGTGPFATNAGETPFSATGGKAEVQTSVNVRLKDPTRLAAVVRTLRPGEQVSYTAVVDSGEAVNGNARWLQDVDGNFLWSGAVKAV